MTITELEEAKKALRKTLESQKEAISITKDELSLFVEFQSRFWKWTATKEDKEAIEEAFEQMKEENL